MTRERSRYNVYPVTDTGEAAKIPQPSGPRSVVHSADVVTQSEFESITDVEVGGFYRKRNAGEIMVNPVTHVKTSIKTTGGGRLKFVRTGSGDIYDYTCDNFTRFATTMWPLQSVPDEPLPSYDMIAAARLQALGNVDRSPYSFAEDIAEMHKTLNFLRAPLTSLRKLSQLMRKDVKTLLSKNLNMRRADAIAKVWLQYQFALMPLVRSANDLVEAVGDKTTRPTRRTARGGSEFLGDDMVNGVLGSYHQSEATISVVANVRAGILYEVTNPLNDWQFKYGLRFKNIPEVLWAIFPYSFMVDRMFNLTQSVRGLTSFLDPNVNILGAWNSSSKTTTSTLSYLNYDSPIVQTMIQMTPDIETTIVDEYVRDPWTPSFNDLVPEIRLKGLIDTSTKIADLSALIWANIR